MGTRPGDLDPGLMLYLLRAQGAATLEAASAVESTLNHKAGMVALSGMANDVQAMRAAADGGDQNARMALKVFTRSVTKAIGGYCFLLGGLDTIVFSGGIGTMQRPAPRCWPGWRALELRSILSPSPRVEMSSASATRIQRQPCSSSRHRKTL
jgi:acetate kinase